MLIPGWTPPGFSDELEMMGVSELSELREWLRNVAALRGGRAGIRDKSCRPSDRKIMVEWFDVEVERPNSSLGISLANLMTL